MVQESRESRACLKVNTIRLDIQNNLSGKNSRLINFVCFCYDFFNHIIRFPIYGFEKTYIKLRGDINKGYLLDYPWLKGFDRDLELNYVFKKSFDKKIAVYSSVFGNYDILPEPVYVSDMCDYFVITDKVIPKNSIWKQITVDDESFENMDDYHKSKYCKLHPHVLFPEYDYSIWVDGNIQIAADLLPLVDRMSPDKCMAAFQNPVHNCIYTEGRYLVYYDIVNLKSIKKQLQKYRKEGFPARFGMREFGIIVRKHHDDQLIDLMDQWWNEVNAYTMRDQISFPYLLWKNGLTIDYVQLLGENLRCNPRFIETPHNRRIKFIK